MTKSIKCFFGLHELEVIEQKEVKDCKDNLIAIVYVEKCKHCGKLTYYRVEF